VDDVIISDNILDWSGSVTSGHNVTSNSGIVYTQGIFLYGNVNGDGSNGNIILMDNTFDTSDDDASSVYQSVAIYISETESGFGTLASDVYLIDTSGRNDDYAEWQDDEVILGGGVDGDGYDMDGGSDGTIALTAGTLTLGDEILFATSDTIS
jgi:hypothetical protein